MSRRDHQQEPPGLRQLDPGAQGGEAPLIGFPVIDEKTAPVKAMHSDCRAPSAAGASGDGLDASIKPEEVRAGACDGHSQLGPGSESEVVGRAGEYFDVEEKYLNWFTN